MKTNNIIVMLTDFGLKDGFVGTMKGVIYGINPRAKIVDLSHDISPQNIREADFVLRSSAKYFPGGSVFLVVVDPGVGSSRKAIILKTGNGLYIAPDNGVLSGIYREEKEVEIIEVTGKKYFLPALSNTFHGRDIFAPVAAHLSKGLPPEFAGEKIQEITIFEEDIPSIDENHKICGTVIYVDKFGNLITNISESFLDKNINPEGKIIFKLKDKLIKGLSNCYSEKPPGEPLAVMGSSGYLEIAVNCGRGEEFFGCGPGEKVFLEFL